MKQPEWRKDGGLYPQQFQLQTRFRDQDILNHVNNIAIAGYYDEARDQLMRHIYGRAAGVELFRIVTADSRVSYLAEVFHPDWVDIRSGVTRIGGASFEVGQAMFQQGRCVGLCSTVMVQATSEGSRPLAAGLRAILQELFVAEPA
jgi:acyl-CoA thioester hydrolase